MSFLKKMPIATKIFLIPGIAALSLGFISSVITSYFAVSALLKLIKQQKFHYFTPYCIILGMFFQMVYFFTSFFITNVECL